jgi:hypothetical protein
MTQEDLNNITNQNHTINQVCYEKYAFCGYRRVGTLSEWTPLDYDTHIKRLQARIEALEAQLTLHQTQQRI